MKFSLRRNKALKELEALRKEVKELTGHVEELRSKAEISEEAAKELQIAVEAAKGFLSHAYDELVAGQKGSTALDELHVKHIKLLGQLREKQIEVKAKESMAALERRITLASKELHKDVVASWRDQVQGKWTKVQWAIGTLLTMSLALFAYEVVNKKSFDEDIAKASDVERDLALQRDRENAVITTTIQYGNVLNDSEFSLLQAYKAEDDQNLPLAILRSERLIQNLKPEIDFLKTFEGSTVFKLDNSVQDPKSGPTHPLPDLAISSLERILANALALKARVLYKFADTGNQLPSVRALALRDMLRASEELEDLEKNTNQRERLADAMRFQAFYFDDLVNTPGDKDSTAQRKIRDDAYHAAANFDDEQKIDLYNLGETELCEGNWDGATADVTSFIEKNDRLAPYHRLASAFILAAADLFGTKNPSNKEGAWYKFCDAYKKGSYLDAKGFNKGSKPFSFSDLEDFGQTMLGKKVCPDDSPLKLYINKNPDAVKLGQVFYNQLEIMKADSIK